jgi:hypothetical protein
VARWIDDLDPEEEPLIGRHCHENGGTLETEAFDSAPKKPLGEILEARLKDDLCNRCSSRSSRANFASTRGR